MKASRNKSKNKRFARKKSLRIKYKMRTDLPYRDSIRGCRRKYGGGLSK